jgi:hypothetical protein
MTGVGGIGRGKGALHNEKENLNRRNLIPLDLVSHIGMSFD